MWASCIGGGFACASQALGILGIPGKLAQQESGGMLPNHWHMDDREAGHPGKPLQQAHSVWLPQHALDHNANIMQVPPLP
jgi:hypothetical protein